VQDLIGNYLTNKWLENELHLSNLLRNSKAKINANLHQKFRKNVTSWAGKTPF
jgi:hypothetical protein